MTWLLESCDEKHLRWNERVTVRSPDGQYPAKCRKFLPGWSMPLNAVPIYKMLPTFKLGTTNHSHFLQLQETCKGFLSQPASGTNAASACNSRSKPEFRSISCAIFTASITYAGNPVSLVEADIATFGFIPTTDFTYELQTAI